MTDWAKVDDLGGIDGYRKAEYMDKVGPGGNAGPPIYVDGHSAMINGVVKDIREPLTHRTTQGRVHRVTSQPLPCFESQPHVTGPD